MDAILFHCARESRLVALSPLSKPRARRVAQGAVLPGLTRTANSVEGGVPTMFAWIPAMAEVVRAGEGYGMTHLMYNRQRVVAPIPDSFMVVPNELERSVGWPTRHTPPGTEMTSFALRCSQLGVQFSWLDAGVHVPIVPGIVALFHNRVRDHAGNLLLMREDSALEPRTQTLLAVFCVSAGFAKIAPILAAISPLVIHMPGQSAFGLACLVGVTAALVHFVYAVGFYMTSGARHLARGPAGYILYWILFTLTLALVPLFSAFELAAMIASVFAAPKLREGNDGEERGLFLPISFFLTFVRSFSPSLFSPPPPCLFRHPLASTPTFIPSLSTPRRERGMLSRSHTPSLVIWTLNNFFYVA